MTKKQENSEPLAGGTELNGSDLAKRVNSDSSATGSEKKAADLLSAALDYAAKGIPVFPCGSNKAPLVEHGFYAATTDARQIRTWWKNWPFAMIGVPTGNLSGIAVLDIDYKPEKGKDGYKAVPDWRTRSPVIAKTRSGGAHLYFRDPVALRSTVDELAHGVDTRGDRAYVIVPPSPGYAWVSGHDLSSLPPWPRDMLLPSARVSMPADDLTADEDDVAAALAVIPNENVSWHEWNRVAMATYAATEGDGFEPFDSWSQKSGKYDPVETQRKWERLKRSPPTHIGAGTIFYMANEARPRWRTELMARLERKLASADADGFIDEMWGPAKC